MLDFHSHILPGMDDGSRSTECSLQMLQEEIAQGVDHVLLTPHFYPWKEDPDAFLARREQTYAKLSEATSGMDIKMHLGAEVAFYGSIGASSSTGRFCIGKSNLLLLEMPFEKWTSATIGEVQKLLSVRRITPVLAHVERYFDWIGFSELQSLSEMGCLIQCNAELFADSPHLAKKIVKKVDVSFLGTDSHNMDKRKPNMGKALEWLSKNNPERLEMIEGISKDVLKWL